MVRKGKRILSNEGAALIVVLVCMLFIGVIAAIVLGLAQSNLKNIGTGMKSSDNFYEAEEALDELKDSLKTLANNAIKVQHALMISQTNDRLPHALLQARLA